MVNSDIKIPSINLETMSEEELQNAFVDLTLLIGELFHQAFGEKITFSINWESEEAEGILASILGEKDNEPKPKLDS